MQSKMAGKMAGRICAHMWILMCTASTKITREIISNILIFLILLSEEFYLICSRLARASTCTEPVRLAGAAAMPNQSNKLRCGGCYETAAVRFTPHRIRVHYELKSPASLHTLCAVRDRPYFRYVTAQPILLS